MTSSEGDMFILFERSSACRLENGCSWWVGMRDQLGGWRLVPGTSSGGERDGRDLPTGTNGTCFGG